MYSQFQKVPNKMCTSLQDYISLSVMSMLYNNKDWSVLTYFLMKICHFILYNVRIIGIFLGIMGIVYENNGQIFRE